MASSAPLHLQAYIIIVIVGIVIILILLYNPIALGWCCEHGFSRRRRHSGSQQAVMPRHGSQVLNSIPVSKYKKEGIEEDLNSECPVCLSVLKEGEDIRKLPLCKHIFHVPCIDMWLHSHFDCPLCRTDLLLPPHLPSTDVVPYNFRSRCPQESSSIFGMTSLLV